ncbi:MAG: hypothetical protein ACE5G1_13775, partial [bacterium]
YERRSGTSHSIVSFGLVGGVLLFYPSKTIPFSERDWILITDFENHGARQRHRSPRHQNSVSAKKKPALTWFRCTG